MLDAYWTSSARRAIGGDVWRPRGRGLIWTGLGLGAALAPAAFMWGFTVDDAFIPIRYAQNLRAGYGWCFNPGAAPSDGVTPLPWPLLLVPIVATDPLSALVRLRALGGGAFGLTGAMLGCGLARARVPWVTRLVALAVLALSLPAAAHAVTGLETAWVTLLVTGGVLLCRHAVLTAVLLGTAVSFRPELGPFALVLSVLRAIELEFARLPVVGPRSWNEFTTRNVGRIVASLLLAAIPLAVVSLVRLFTFGRAFPLAVLAKPSDLSHGFAYAGAATLVGLTPGLLISRSTLRDARSRPVALATLAHVAAMTLVGGDWMPYGRLVAPIVPACAWAFVRAQESSRGSRSSVFVRTAGIAVLGVFVAFRAAPAGRRVFSERAGLIERARGPLGSSTRLATVDVGWPTAATAAAIVDLSGLTDPSFAVLPGGHTSKRVDASMLVEREVDSVLLYVNGGMGGGGLEGWRSAAFGHAAGSRLASSNLFRERFAPREWLPLGDQGAGYLLFGRLRSPLSEEPGRNAR